MLLCRIHSPVCYQVYLLGFCTFLPTCLFQWQYFSISLNSSRAFSIFCNIQIYPYISSNILVAMNLCTLYDKNTIATFILVITRWYLIINHHDHIIYQPGQGDSLQPRVSMADEPSIVQSSPPYLGEGLLHSRVLVCVDLPQVTEHLDHSVQSPQSPFSLSWPSGIKCKLIIKL